MRGTIICISTDGRAIHPDLPQRRQAPLSQGQQSPHRHLRLQHGTLHRREALLCVQEPVRRTNYLSLPLLASVFLFF